MEFRGTTIVAVKKGNQVAVAGDGQITLGDKTIMKSTARKVRRLYHDQVIVGIAGSVADALTLLDKLESKLNEHRGNLQRAAVDLAREWRTDRYLRKLEALMLAADARQLLLIAGSGEVIEPDDGVAAIGSGGPYALAAARSLSRHTDLPPSQIARHALQIAAEICVYTNDQITVEEIGGTKP
ncbi:ATP-dependent protease subunit HslV [Heliophilum fasciatum]|uniref:ATP-dependent protease subunit HslV n=1 Tax=Heliophilum fasciatum TaxID=35700 RepID=A0A4R2RP47_9FIRM|nr:ATP-dependent protease subunit HslV [Heliophilum fasciatum]MCW2277951.1 ATP-dependent HslUV protease subunit HslV [Heliophilum fasciatum]TCP64479.1 ATP dependent peptidase CodWX CodW component [Heliophilum fasciatum]